MTSMKIVQLFRYSSIYVQNTSTPWMSNFRRPPPCPNVNQSVKRKHNPRMSNICYHVLVSGRLSFLVSTH